LDASDEMNLNKQERRTFNPEPLTWQEVFETEYYLDEE
jgi:hypothetical protein